MKNNFFFILILLSIKIVEAQSISEYSITEIVDYILEEYSDDENEEQLYDIIDDLLDNPININNSSEKDFLVLPFMNYSIAKKITENIPYKNFEEVKTKNNLDVKTFLLLKYFITIGIIPKRGNIFSELKNSKFIFRNRISNPIKKPFNTYQKYEGSKIKLYKRLKIINDKFIFGAVAEKDNGENKVADFYSISMAIKNIGIFKNISIGNYLIESGQGLLLWSPYAFSKSINTVNSPIKRGKLCKGFFSTDENRFLRGISTTLTYRNFGITTFYSNKKIDASLTENNEIKSLKYDGYHRTELEKEKFHNVQETSYGIIFSSEFYDNFSFQFLHFGNKFSLPFFSKKKYSPSGKQFYFNSLSYSFYSRKFSFAGEIASNQKGLAGIVNFKIFLDKNFSFITSYRNYSKEYFSFYSKGFGETNNTNNEKGFYTGVRFRNKIMEINFYYDLFKFPYKANGNIFPSSGKEFLCNTKIYFQTKAFLTLTYKNEKKYFDFYNRKRTQLRGEVNFSPQKNIYLKSRIEISKIKFDNYLKDEKGILIFQDVKYYIGSVIFFLRFTVFDTESYNSRIYEFENDFVGIMHNIPLFNKGFKWYLMLKYNISENVKLSFKYSHIEKEKPKNLNSFTDENIGLQLDYNF